MHLEVGSSTRKKATLAAAEAAAASGWLLVERLEVDMVAIRADVEWLQAAADGKRQRWTN